jgi:hypothetical protein
LQNVFDFETGVITQSLTLYAKWTSLNSAIPQTWDQAGVDAVLNDPQFIGIVDLSGFTASPMGNVTINVPVDKNMIIKGNPNVEFAGVAIVSKGNNHVTINNLRMKSADGQAKSALYFASGNNTLTLVGTNAITTVHTALTVGNGAGVGIPVGSALTIQAADTSQTLAVTGAIEGAGIGGGKGSAPGAITIAGGKITATAGGHAAGIGGGRGGAGGEITITGGTIALAKGGNSAAGIGGGNGGAGGTITINGGTVTATGANGAAGVGDGVGGTGSNIAISGGTITANGGSSGAGIGGTGDTITVIGGAIMAIGGGSAGAGIGGSMGSAGGNISISGGTITATGGGNSANAAAGIGGGKNGAGGNIIISGGSITATGGGVTTALGAGIGGGENGASGNILIYGENTQVTAIAKAATVANIGAGSGASGAGNVFVALPKGKLRNQSADLGNTVAFSSTTASPGTVTAELPSPWNAAPFPAAVGLLTNLNATPMNMSVITTLSDKEVSFEYPNATTMKRTGVELATVGAAVTFESAVHGDPIWYAQASNGQIVVQLNNEASYYNMSKENFSLVKETGHNVWQPFEFTGVNIIGNKAYLDFTPFNQTIEQQKYSFYVQFKGFTGHRADLTIKPALNKYTIEFVGFDGSTVLQTLIVEEGQTIDWTLVNPVAFNTDTDVWKGWYIAESGNPFWGANEPITQNYRLMPWVTRKE